MGRSSHAVSSAPWSQRQDVVLALRIVSVVLGFLGAVAALFSASLVTLLSNCSGGVLRFCTDYTGLALAVEWALVITAVVAPLAGGISSCRRREWRWLPAGLVTAAGAVWLSYALEASQSPY